MVLVTSVDLMEEDGDDMAALGLPNLIVGNNDM